MHRFDPYTERCLICGMPSKHQHRPRQFPWSIINALYHLLFWWAPSTPTMAAVYYTNVPTETRLSERELTRVVALFAALGEPLTPDVLREIERRGGNVSLAMSDSAAWSQK